MEHSELIALAAALSVMISNSLPDDGDLALFTILLDLLGDNLDAILAQRALLKNKEVVVVPEF